MKGKYQRKEEVAKRQAVYNGLTKDQKIQLCKTRRGESKKELTRLTRQEA